PMAQVNLGGNGQTNGIIIVRALGEDKEAGNQEIVYNPPSHELKNLLQTFLPSTPEPTPTITPTPTPSLGPTPTPTLEPTPTAMTQSGPPVSIVGWKER
ncbi:MAG: hypothetical protein N2205_03615, partial [Candidatus Caldatribacterium sp.]|nr:hypothetical protein [Candidatus Caldatribacterium sp.]